MSEEWGSGGYDGGMLGDSKKKKSSSHTRIPRFKKIKRSRSRIRGRRPEEPDAEIHIVIWAAAAFLLSAVMQAEWIAGSYFISFVLYAFLTKDIGPLKFLSNAILIVGILFLIALTLVQAISLLADSGFLKDPATIRAYKYIVGVPILSWSLVRITEAMIDGPRKHEFKS